MANTAKEIVTVESITQWGIKANGVNYRLSNRLKESGVDPESFEVGQTYSMDVWTGPQGGKSINSFEITSAGEEAPAPVAPKPLLRRPVPSLPQTTVHTTPAPGGVPPVRPAVRPSVAPATDPDRMSKQDWADRNRTIELQAILKSTLESPMLAQLAVGKNTLEALGLVETVFTSALALYDKAKVN